MPYHTVAVIVPQQKLVLSPMAPTVRDSRSQAALPSRLGAAWRHKHSLPERDGHTPWAEQVLSDTSIGQANNKLQFATIYNAQAHAYAEQRTAEQGGARRVRRHRERYGRTHA
jgi:hypothetical protein